MAACSLSSTIRPVGERGHRIVVTAVAGNKRDRGHDVIDFCED